MKPITTGDGGFDAAFEVHAFEPQYVSAAVSERVRSRLLELASGYPGVVVDDHGVLVQNRIGASALDRSLDDVLSIAELVDFTRPTTPSPYR